MLRAGQVIDRFELVCPIGEGGMAHVWAARQRGVKAADRVVALKVIHSRFAEDPEFRAMFLDEGRIVAPIEHPNVARVYDLVDTPAQLYLVMEYVHGESLFGLISQYRTAPIPIALRIAADACAGLHAVHSLVDPLNQPRNVVHRDVSPQNILLSLKGDTKLIDFGIAKAADRQIKDTALGTVKGKIRYMAPEQARRETLGPWTDVFGIGATLFRAIVGKAPYQAERDIETTQALLTGAPPFVSFPPDLPAPIVAVISRAIAPKVADRYRTAAELEHALRDLLAKSGERPDLPGWIGANLSDKTRELHAQLGKIFEEDPTSMTTRGTAIMSPMGSFATAPTQPDRKRGPLPPPPGQPAPGPSLPGGPPKAEPGFMDVRAILQNANAVPDLPVPVAPRPPPQQPPQAQRAPQQPIELAFEPSHRKVEAAPNAGPIRVAILIVAGVLVLFVLLFAVPFIVKSRAVSTARDAGFEMTAEHVGVGFGSATFRGVTMKAIKVPGVSMTIDELAVNGYNAKELHAIGLTFQLDGNPADFEMGLGLMLAENRVRFAGTPSAPRHYTIASSRVDWKGPNGAELDAGDFGLDIESRGNGNEDVKGNVGRFLYKTGKTTIGPWGVAIESAPASSRVRIALDPAVPDGPSVLFVSSPSSPGTITINALRAPIANLGLKPAELGLPMDASTEIESKLTGTLTADGKLAMTGTTALWGLKIAGAPKPVDITMNLGLGGTLGAPLDIDRASTVSFGPFVAGLSGTVTEQNGNVRVDVLAKAAPIQCEKLVRSQAQTMGSFTAMMTALGQSITGLKVKGDVNLSCSVKFDTSDPDSTSVTWLTRETCGLSIFGQ